VSKFVFWTVTQYGLVSEERATSIFRTTNPHDVTSQKTHSYCITFHILTSVQSATLQLIVRIVIMDLYSMPSLPFRPLMLTD
jgi:hypothetical protein